MSNYDITYNTAKFTITAKCTYTGTFQAPIKDGTINLVKNGSVVPVKLTLRDCNGTVVTGRKLEIKLVTGVLDTQDTSDGTATVLESVSSADTNGVMRVVDSHYMYNLSTKGLTNGTKYTIVIKDTTDLTWTSAPRLATAVIEPRK